MLKLRFAVLLIFTFLPVFISAQSSIVNSKVRNVTDLPAGITVWARYKASSMTEIADGSPSGQWTDISGNGRHAINALVVRQPVMETSAEGLAGNTKAFDFTPRGGQLEMPSMAAVTEAEIFFFVKADRDPSLFISRGNALHGIFAPLQQVAYPYTDGVVYEWFGRTSSVNFNPAAGLNQWRNYNVSSGNGSNNWKAFVDNILVHETAVTAISFPTNPYIGRTRAPSDSDFYGKIAEIIILSAIPTTSQRSAINLYFQKQYLGL